MTTIRPDHRRPNLTYTEREIGEWLAWLPHSTADRAWARLTSARRLGFLTPASAARIEAATAAIHPRNTEHEAQ